MRAQKLIEHTSWISNGEWLCNTASTHCWLTFIRWPPCAHYSFPNIMDKPTKSAHTICLQYGISAAHMPMLSMIFPIEWVMDLPFACILLHCLIHQRDHRQWFTYSGDKDLNFGSVALFCFACYYINPCIYLGESIHVWAKTSHCYAHDLWRNLPLLPLSISCFCKANTVSISRLESNSLLSTFIISRNRWGNGERVTQLAHIDTHRIDSNFN